MTTEDKTTSKCYHCRNAYTPSRPKCTGAECAHLRTELYSGVCGYCCFAYITVKKLRPRLSYRHIADNYTYFLCYSCGRSRNQLCNCCEQSFLCDACCDNYRHKLCCKQSVIEFVNNGLYFAFPAAKKNPAFLDRNGSVDVLTKTFPLSKLNPKGFSLNSSRRFASTEIEIFSYKNATALNSAINKWHGSVVRDGSILREAQARGIVASDKTFEINTSPACGNSLYQELKEICEGLAKAEAEVTTGCGIHVHVDCRDFGYQEIQKLVRAYYYIEDALFAAVHWTRHGNDFCKPCGQEYYDQVISGIKADTKSLKPALIKGVYGAKSLEPRTFRKEPNFWTDRVDHYGRPAGLPREQRNEKRYSAINLHSYFLRGTVESRIHHGSTDFEEIYGWTKLLIDLFDSIYKLSEAQLAKILEVSPYEIEEAKNLIKTGEFLLPRNYATTSSIAKGVVILRSLLPDNSFNVLLNKIEANNLDPKVANTRVLPCQRVKPEVLKPPDEVNVQQVQQERIRAVIREGRI